MQTNTSFYLIELVTKTINVFSCGDRTQFLVIILRNSVFID